MCLSMFVYLFFDNQIKFVCYYYLLRLCEFMHFREPEAIELQDLSVKSGKVIQIGNVAIVSRYVK